MTTNNNTTNITAVLPAHNEAKRIIPLLKTLKDYTNEIIVVDDHSTDDTATKAAPYATVLKNPHKKGYINAIKHGFKHAHHDIIITLDADGEHNPADIPRLIKPITQGNADLVFGVRSNIPRPSERFINTLTNLKVNTTDCGTGYRALSRTLAQQLTLTGRCTCGIFALEAHHNGARITDVPITTQHIDKTRTIACQHLPQLMYVFRWLLKRPSRFEL